MTTRIQKNEIAKRVASRLSIDEKVSEEYLDAVNKIRKWFQNPQKILGPYLKEGMTVLDLGCGPGFFSIDMAHMVGKSGRVIAFNFLLTIWMNKNEYLDYRYVKGIGAGVGERVLQSWKQRFWNSEEDIFKVSAPPGFSEHHTGKAVDINTKGFPPLEKDFEKSDAFKWLSRKAKDFGFRLSYPRENRFGIVYEP